MSLNENEILKILIKFFNNTKNCEIYLNSLEFLKISDKSLEILIKMDEFSIQEEKIFFALIKWSETNQV